MQSSPPTRPWARSMSEVDSNYSVDLAALDLDSHSGASSPLAAAHVDRILSEDIDGPTDFTLNMEKWMRGGSLRSGTVCSSKRVMQTTKNEAHGDSKMLGAAKLVSTPPHTFVVKDYPAMILPHSDIVQQQPAQAHNPQQQAGDADDLDGGSQNDASTAQAPNKRKLQPTVEDYQSELIRTHAPATGARSRENSLDVTANEDGIFHETAGPPSPERPSSEAFSPVRSPMSQRAILRGESYLEADFEQLRERCKQLENANNTLSRALEQERRVREEEDAAYKSKMDSLENREHNLKELTKHAERHREDLGREHASLMQNLHARRAEQGLGREQFACAHEDHASEIQELKDGIERERLQVVQKIRALEHDVQLSRRSRDEAEANVRTLEDLLNRQHGGRDEMESTLTRLHEAEPQARIAELEDSVRALRGENETYKNARAVSPVLNCTHCTGTAVDGVTFNEEVARLTIDQRRAITLAEGLQAELKNLRQQFRDEQTAHDAEIERLQATHAQAKQDNGAIEDIAAARADAETKNTALNEAILDRDEMQDALEFTRAELDALKTELSNVGAANTAMDLKVSEAVRRRETYWRDRLRTLEAERNTMAKVLLRQWGREEVGIDVPDDAKQAYAFKYAKGPRRAERAQMGV